MNRDDEIDAALAAEEMKWAAEAATLKRRLKDAESKLEEANKQLALADKIADVQGERLKTAEHRLDQYRRSLRDVMAFAQSRASPDVLHFESLLPKDFETVVETQCNHVGWPLTVYSETDVRCDHCKAQIPGLIAEKFGSGYRFKAVEKPSALTD